MPTERKKGVKSAARTELVAVRFDPETKFLMDLAARVQRRSTANYVEWAVEESFSQVALHAEAGEAVTLAQVRAKLWNADAPDRLCNVATRFPQLLSLEEQREWRLISELQRIAPLAEDVNPNDDRFDIGVAQRERVRRHWELIKSAAASGAPASVVLASIEQADKVKKG